MSEPRRGIHLIYCNLCCSVMQTTAPLYPRTIRCCFCKRDFHIRLDDKLVKNGGTHDPEEADDGSNPEDWDGIPF